MMFYVTLVTLFQLILGVFFIEGTLSSSITGFLFYWGFCVSMVICMGLLALYDMLAVKNEQRQELRKLRESVFGRQKNH